MVSDLKGLTGRSGWTSQGLGSFARSPESRIRTARRRHLASQFLTPAGGCLAVSFERCWESQPRRGHDVCDEPLGTAAAGLGGRS